MQCTDLTYYYRNLSIKKVTIEASILFHLLSSKYSGPLLWVQMKRNCDFSSLFRFIGLKHYSKVNSFKYVFLRVLVVWTILNGSKVFNCISLRLWFLFIHIWNVSLECCLGASGVSFYHLNNTTKSLH